MTIIGYNSPYWGKSFFSFFYLFFSRMISLIRGDIALQQLASDEIQVFVLMGISVSCAMIGVFLVLKKQAMLANALSHTVLIGIVIAYVLLSYISSYSFASFPVLFVASFISALLTVFFTQFFTHAMRLQEDASVGLVFSFLFAIGILLTSVLTKNVHIGIEVVMGNVDLVHGNDLKMVIYLVCFNAVVISLFYRQLHITVFDENLARSYGIPAKFFNYLLMFQTAATVIGSFRIVGVLLVLAFIVMPSVIARFFTHKLFFLLIVSCGLGIGVSLVGAALSRHMLSIYHMPLPTSGLIIAVFIIIFLLSIIYFFQKKKLYHFITKMKRAKKLTQDFDQA